MKLTLIVARANFVSSNKIFLFCETLFIISPEHSFLTSFEGYVRKFLKNTPY